MLRSGACSEVEEDEAGGLCPLSERVMVSKGQDVADAPGGDGSRQGEFGTDCADDMGRRVFGRGGT